jgi:endo-1,4-beta-xylanase
MTMRIDEISAGSGTSQPPSASPYDAYLQYLLGGVGASEGASDDPGFGSGYMSSEVMSRMEEVLLAAIKLLIAQLRQFLPDSGGACAGSSCCDGPSAMGSASPMQGISGSGSGSPGGVPYGGGGDGGASSPSSSAGPDASSPSAGIASGPGMPSSLAPSGALGGGASLKNNAAQYGMFAGTAISQAQLNDPAFMAKASQQFGVLTPEIAMKWDEIDAKGFADADAMIAKADEYGMKVRGHTLVWHQQMPDRLNGMSAGQVEQEMTSHIADTLQHFGNKVGTWDVVNEAFSDGGDNGGFRDTVFSRSMGGQGFIDKAFVAARQAAPNAELVLNDYNIETINPKSDKVYEAVRSMKERGIPIDAVGIQAHVAVGEDLSSMAANIKRFKDLGVNVQITELDVKGGDAAAKAQVAHDVFTAAKAGGAAGINFWGYRDSDQSYAANPDELFDAQGNIRSDILQAFT